MAVKVAHHESYISGFSTGVKHNERNKELVTVYSTDEVNASMASLQQSFDTLRNDLANSKIALNTSIRNSLEAINQQLGLLPDIIKNDEEFRTSLKNEILEELRSSNDL
jgi:tetrahydromethanopterin S-methyltransferase subunit B